MKLDKVIINTDLDGILSGLLLHHFLGTEVVGFCDSGEFVWKSPSVAWSQVAFVDMFVPLKGIKTYCNHIIAVDEPHAIDLFWDNDKNNPNVDVATRYFLGEYPRKFALSTFLYLVALLEQDGVQVYGAGGIRLTNIVEGFRCVDVVLRADDVANITLNTYRDNALFWWARMIELSKVEPSCLTTMFNYLDGIHSGRLPFDMYSFKERFFKFVKHSYGCDSPDGGYKGLNFAQDKLSMNTKNYIRFLSHLTGLRCFGLDLDLVVYQGVSERAEPSPNDLEDIKLGNFRGRKLFSYAFVSMQTSPRHFSCTYDLKRL